MVKTFRLLFALVMSTLCFGVLGQPAAQSVQEFRNHYRVATDAEVLYEVTEIVRLADESDESIALVRDHGYGDFLLHHRWSLKDQTVTHRISDVPNRSYIQSSFKLPLSAKTRVEALKEGRQLPVDIPVNITLETNGGKWEGLETAWEEDKPLRQLRSELRQTMPFWLLEVIERMRGTFFSTSNFAHVFYTLIVRYVVYDSRNDARSDKVKQVAAAADCEFDAALGYPCSMKQRERLAKAVEQGKTVSSY